MQALTVENLTKVYPAFTLHAVSFSVDEGEVVGLIGRNGAGKSTTLKGIFRLISTTGEVRAFGNSFATDEARAKSLVGYLGGGFRFYPQKKLKRVAKVVSAFYPNWQESEYRRYLREFQLDENKKVSELSEGMKVKFALALALSHGAKLLVLDEPTSGLDPLSREEFCDIILDLVKREGVSVLFSTHVTSDLEKIADKIVYLSGGRVLANEGLSNLLARYRVGIFDSFEAVKECPVQVIGQKAVKRGYEGLISVSAPLNGVKTREATLDDIMIFLEREGNA